MRVHSASAAAQRVRIEADSVRRRGRRACAHSRNARSAIRRPDPAESRRAHRTLRPPSEISTTSPVATPSRSAVRGEIHTALSHVILFCGFGISWSHALFENAPSPMAGSGRNTISSPGARACGAALGNLRAPAASFPGNAVPAIDAVVQRDLPEIVEVRAFVLRLPVVAERCRGWSGRPSCSERSGLRDSVLPPIHRLDQRLNDGRGAVLGARVAPGFQIVRLRHMPVAPRRGLVVVESRRARAA